MRRSEFSFIMKNSKCSNMYSTILKTIKWNWLYSDEYDYETDISAIFYGINRRDKYARIIKVHKYDNESNRTNVKFNIVNNSLYNRIKYINQSYIDELSENIENHNSISSIILDSRNCIGGNFMQTICMMDIFNGRYKFSLIKKKIQTCLLKIMIANFLELYY